MVTGHQGELRNDKLGSMSKLYPPDLVVTYSWVNEESEGGCQEGKLGLEDTSVMANMIVLVALFQEATVKHLQLYTSPTDRLISMYDSLYKQVCSKHH